MQAECYDYLFEAAVKMQGLDLDASVAPGLHNGVTSQHQNGAASALLTLIAQLA